MKLALLGGGGVRSPFLAKSIAHSAAKANITDVVFMDNDAEKLRFFGTMACMIGEKINPAVTYKTTTDVVEAVKDADFVITTLRVGQDEGRVKDERIALKMGLLGQETTGAGGFGMALRSVDVLTDYCSLIKEQAKENVLIFNFTNPSGIVTQALRDAGHDNVYGICDAPSEFIKQLESLYQGTDDFAIKCFGLNHLSWFGEATLNGIDVTESLLKHPRLYEDTEMRLFTPELTEAVGGLMPNEYLYFYYSRDKAVRSVLDSGKTRGETILEVNRDMMTALRKVDVASNLENAFHIFMKHYLIRENSYFSIESGQTRPRQLEVPTLQEFLDAPDEGGYAGVALNFVRAYVSGEPVEMVLSIPNMGAIDGLKDSDVIEISCRIEKDRVIPMPPEKVPEPAMNLIRTVKYYERQVVKAIREKDRKEAVKGLMVHPLINDYDLATGLVDSYIEAHKDYIGAWQ